MTTTAQNQDRVRQAIVGDHGDDQQLARLRRLLDSNTEEVDESLADTMVDLAGYCILWLEAPCE